MDVVVAVFISVSSQNVSENYQHIQMMFTRKNACMLGKVLLLWNVERIVVYFPGFFTHKT